MDIRELRPPVEDGPFPPPTHYPPISTQGVRGARSWTGLTYAFLGGFRPLTLDLHVPTQAPGPVPLVLWIHGGGWVEGDRRYVPLQWGQQTLFDTVVAAGMAVATVDYRLLAEAPFPAPVQDCFAALRYLRSYASELGLDGGRVGVWGESAGAQLTALIAFAGSKPYADPHLVGDLGVGEGPVDAQAAVLFYGPDRLDEFAAGDGGAPFLGSAAFGHDPAVLRAMAPAEHVHGAIPPTLLMHGDSDGVVGVGHSERLHAALLEAGVDSTLAITPGADHCFIGPPIGPHLDRAVAHLQAHLGHGPQPQG